MNGEFILVGVIFILILFVSTYGSSKSFVPYLPMNPNLPQSPYEGFISTSDFSTGNDQPMAPLVINPSKQSDLSQDIPRSEILQGSDYSKPNAVIDTISNLPSSIDCIGKASNLSNSTGGICFDDITLRLIKSRGNNQT